MLTRQNICHRTKLCAVSKCHRPRPPGAGPRSAAGWACPGPPAPRTFTDALFELRADLAHAAEVLGVEQVLGGGLRGDLLQLLLDGFAYAHRVHLDT